MHSGGGGGWLRFTCPDCKLNMPTSIPDEHMGVSPPGLTAAGATTRVFEKLVRYTDLSSDDCDIVRILISLDKQKGPYENPH